MSNSSGPIGGGPRSFPQLPEARVVANNEESSTTTTHSPMHAAEAPLLAHPLSTIVDELEQPVPAAAVRMPPAIAEAPARPESPRSLGQWVRGLLTARQSPPPPVALGVSVEDPRTQIDRLRLILETPEASASEKAAAGEELSSMLVHTLSANLQQTPSLRAAHHCLCRLPWQLIDQLPASPANLEAKAFFLVMARPGVGMMPGPSNERIGALANEAATYIERNSDSDLDFKTALNSLRLLCSIDSAVGIVAATLAEPHPPAPLFSQNIMDRLEERGTARPDRLHTVLLTSRYGYRVINRLMQTNPAFAQQMVEQQGPRLVKLIQHDLSYRRFAREGGKLTLGAAAELLGILIRSGNPATVGAIESSARKLTQRLIDVLFFNSFAFPGRPTLVTQPVISTLTGLLDLSQTARDKYRNDSAKVRSVQDYVYRDLEPPQRSAWNNTLTRHFGGA